jgi:hypothetical protein
MLFVLITHVNKPFDNTTRPTGIVHNFLDFAGYKHRIYMLPILTCVNL